MKKIIVLLTALFFLNSGAFAETGNNLSNSISKQLHLPAYLKTKKLNEKVNVQFKVLPGGNILLVNVNTDHPELKAYIMKQFPKIVMTDLKPEGTYFIDINFRVL
ncbi:MAG: hypothetical protein M3R27_08620 [Bacteroidota bacterium]|nr:hypothetical protein [Bacteroidota bacterium]